MSRYVEMQISELQLVENLFSGHQVDDKFIFFRLSQIGPMSQRENVDCVNNGVDVSVGVGVGAGVGVGVSGSGSRCQSRCWSTGVCLVVAFPPITSLDFWGARLRSGSLTTQVTIYALGEIHPLMNTLYYYANSFVIF